MTIHICLAMMIKNEEKTILKSLNSCKTIVSSVYIYDTGSDDNTLTLIDEFQKENPSIKVNVKHGDFVDFAESRNVLLEFVEQDDDIQFVILLDSNDELKGCDELYTLLEKEATKTKEDGVQFVTGYLVRQRWFTGNGMDTYFNYRIIRAKSGWRYRAPVHEYLQNELDSNTITTRIDNADIFIYQDRTQDCESSYKRFQRDKDILLKEHFKNPVDTRTLFYLAQTYSSLGMTKEAYYYYKLRVKYGGYEEERYHSFFRLGEMAKNTKMDDEIFLQWWIKAMESLQVPRVEPIVELASYYLFTNVNYEIASIFTTFSLTLEYPYWCNLFINKIHYDYTRYQMDGITQYYLENYEQGLDSCRKAIQYNQDLMKNVSESVGDIIKYKMTFDVNNEKKYLEKIEEQKGKVGVQTNTNWYNYTTYDLEACVLREYNHVLYFHKNEDRYTLEKDTLIKTYESTKNVELLYHIAMSFEKLHNFNEAYYYYKQFVYEIYKPLNELRKQHKIERKQMHKELKDEQIVKKIDTSNLSKEEVEKLNSLDEHQIKRLNDMTNRHNYELKETAKELVKNYEEILYNAFLRLGDVAKILNKDSSTSITWWLKSLEVCTEIRIEALIKIVNHYVFHQVNYHLANMYLKKALSLPKPKADKYKMFFNKMYYDYTRYALNGIIQYYLHNYKEGMESCQKGIDFCKYAIKKCIGNDNLKTKFMEKMRNDLKNIVYYTDKIKELENQAKNEMNKSQDN